ncbi:hypothetical protein D3C79_1081420 [compost metagenome]
MPVESSFIRTTSPCPLIGWVAVPTLTSATIHMEPSGPVALARTVSTPSGKPDLPT